MALEGCTVPSGGRGRAKPYGCHHGRRPRRGAVHGAGWGRSGGLAAWAAAKKFQQVALNAVAGTRLQTLDHRAQLAVVE